MKFLRNLSKFFSTKPNDGPFGSLKVGLVADELTRSCLALECRVRHLSPKNFRRVIDDWRPDLIFVESAWHGHRNAWKYGLASYEGHQDRTNSNLADLLKYARLKNINAIFWNKEDSVHYKRFISTASLFEYIFTVDQNCLSLYQKDVPGLKHVGVMMFPVQGLTHFLKRESGPPIGFSSFVGSYSSHVHERRRGWQDRLFDVFSPHGLDIYDRNSRRKSKNYRYPLRAGMRVFGAVPYHQTADLFRRYKVNLNVNTIEDSPTMYSRRLIEIISVGGVAVSTPSAAVSRLFSEYCQIVDSRESMAAALELIKGQKYSELVERARAGASYIAQNHTWTNRLRDMEQLGLF